MKNVLRKLSFKNSRYGYLFNWRDVNAKGRTCMVLHDCLGSAVTCLSGGIFYTSFLMMNGIDLVKIGIISFVPFIATCFSIFSPFILERFPKRKFILTLTRGLYHVLNILGVTVMPYLVQDPQAQLVWFLIIVFAANIINAIGGSGYSVWHIHYLPNNVRPDYFAISRIISAFASTSMSLLFSLIADSLASSPYQNTIIIIFRFAAFAAAILDLIVLCLPKEPEYARSDTDKPKFRDIFVMPIRHQKFLLTMAIVFVYTFFTNVTAGQENYYLLNNVGVDYTYISIINILWPPCMFAFTPLWKKVLRRLDWFKTFAFALLLYAPTNLMYSCVTANNYIWLFTATRLIQHITGVGQGLAYANLSYINLPAEDQTNYLSFQLLITNIASFLGMMCGTWFVSLTQNTVVTFLNLPFTAVQMLYWIRAAGEFMVPLAVVLLLKKLTPDPETI